MNGMPSNRPFASSVARMSSLLRTSTQSPTFNVLRIFIGFISLAKVIVRSDLRISRTQVRLRGGHRLPVGRTPEDAASEGEIVRLLSGHEQQKAAVGEQEH